MSKFDSLFIVLIILFTGITYIATSDYICSGVVLLSSIIYFFLIARNLIKTYLSRSSRFHSCYSFINSFIISLSIKGSLLAAFDSTKLNMDKEYLSIYNGILSLNDEEKLDYLGRYYTFDIYQLFLSIVKIYIEQGGDVFNLSRYLTNELRRNEDYLIKCEAIVKRKIVDFASLWLFTLLILIILKFSLTNFYSTISNLWFFKVAIVGLFIFVLVSIHILIMKVISIKIRGFENVR